MEKRIRSSLCLPHAPVIRSYASIAGQKEGDGPMGDCFDRVEQDAYFGETTWERAESRMQADVLTRALEKGELPPAALDCIVAGDLINQCTSSTFAMRSLHVPFLGVYGACSTMAESLLLSSLLVDGGFCRNAAAVTSSHFSTAERQFRFPLSYGGQRTPTSQWTCTAAGAVVVSAEGTGVRVRGGCIGKIVDYGISDANNMGAAMAPAAADTIFRYLQDTGTAPEDYDCVVTGDLGNIGSSLLLELLRAQGVNLAVQHRDCGAMMFDEHSQDTHAGGSGCGCAASLLCGHFLPQLERGEIRRMLFAATGALLSPMSAQQGESIPCISHLVALTAEGVE
ncbi:MAG: stage V sporulation protein AD [Ruminococcus sp.]|jgi:stage V sporulation protein AD|nr:stage V sporulation protein AD [Ruminococcus sp.]